MASLDGDEVVYCNFASLNFLRKKDVYQPLLRTKNITLGCAGFLSPVCALLPMTGSQRYVYLAIMYSSKAAGLATTGLYVRNLLASST